MYMKRTIIVVSIGAGLIMMTLVYIYKLPKYFAPTDVNVSGYEIIHYPTKSPRTVQGMNPTNATTDEKNVLYSPLFVTNKSHFIANDNAIVNENKRKLMNKTTVNYAVLSVTVTLTTIERYHYAFQVPLTILAWKRIGFEVIVLIVGNEEDWQNDPCLRLILIYIKELKAVYIFLDVSEHQAVMISQVSRIFAVSLLSNILHEHDYLITTDADIWPLDESFYQLKYDKDILVLNSDCCGVFNFKNVFYRMIPMANVGAHCKTWKQIIRSRNQTVPSTVEEIIVYLKTEFGDIVNKRVMKGANKGWYMDQHLLSMLLSNWIISHDVNQVNFVRRDVGNDRVDRSAWSTKTIQGKIDVHTLENMFRTDTWLRTLPLLREMYGDNQYSSLYSVCLLYFKEFNDKINDIT